MGTGKFNAGGNPKMDKHPIQGGVEILLVTLCYRNRKQRALLSSSLHALQAYEDQLDWWPAMCAESFIVWLSFASV